MAEEGNEWALVACSRCGSLVQEKIAEDGSSTFKPLLERASELPGEKIVKMFRPVFSGEDLHGNKITLYKHATREDELWIDTGDGELKALPRGVEIYTREDRELGRYYVQINSLVWSGVALGDRWMMLEADQR